MTERREAEQQAAEAEARFREVDRAGPADHLQRHHHVVQDPPAAHVEYMSPEMSSLLGYPVDEIGDDQDGGSSWCTPTTPPR